MKRSNPWLAMAAAIILVAVAFDTVSAANHIVTLQTQSFSPASLSISLGDTVVWRNSSTRTHTTTSGTSCAPDGHWNSGSLAPGDSFVLVLGTTGTYPYFCIPHCAMGMTGTLTVTATGVAGTPDPVTRSDGFRLMQNRPNPFNPFTLIDYEVAKPGNASIKVFNVAGQAVRVLVEGYKPSGLYTILWDGRNAAGEPAAAGVYYYQLNVDGRTSEKRMIKLQ
ncbi:T9SS type A sorting domain-containing protein [bacterium]|nr:T9SS type A sorting domain-containing protein [bacterium]